MILNYIKIAWRNLINQKLYSLINISGLAIGLAVCMMIMLYVTHEMSYDNFHKNAKLIFKPQAKIKIGGNTMNMAYMSYATAPLVKQSVPVVKDYMRTLGYFKPIVVNNPATPNVKFSDSKLLFADAGFFNFFSFRLLSGSTADVLSKPFSVVITRDMATKYFGTENPVGKTLTIKTDSTYTYQVTGVAENSPSNSSIDFNFVTSGTSLLSMKEAKNYVGSQSVGAGSFDIYMLVDHIADTTAVRRGMQAMVKNDKNFADMEFSFTPLTDIHLKIISGTYQIPNI